MDKAIIIIILTVVILGFTFWGFQTGFFIKKEVIATPLPEGIVLFFGQDCPHCKLVDEFVAQNNIKEKVSFTELEVWNNKSNAKLLVDVAVKCKQDITKGVGVPFLYDGQNCLVGDVDIINFFRTKAGIQ